MEHIQFSIICLSVHIQTTQYRVEQIVLRNIGLIGQVLQTGGLHAMLLVKIGIGPKQHLNVGLLFGRNRIRCAMQIQPFFTQRFAMVRQVNQSGVHILLLL